MCYDIMYLLSPPLSFFRMDGLDGVEWWVVLGGIVPGLCGPVHVSSVLPRLPLVVYR